MAKKRAATRAAKRSKKTVHVHSEQCDHDHAPGGAPPVGTIGWLDLTVKDAGRLRDFYAAVVGWKPRAIDMGGYSDWSMEKPDDAEPAAGICSARGRNAGLPAQWLAYVAVASLKRSLTAAKRRRGKVLFGPRELMGGSFAVIRDPAGAVLALFEAPKP